MIELIFAVSLFVIYFSLWSAKRLALIRNEKIDPQVMGKSGSNIQQYMNLLSRFLMVYILILIPLHALNIGFYGLFERFRLVDTLVFDILGFAIGLLGLSLCLYAQIKMGASWRVGIDSDRKTKLITSGLYSLIRNPTYLGLFMVCAGIWLIWPTFAIFVFSGTFMLFLEIQVRCEEDFLEIQFPGEYREYKNTTKRYFPFIY